MLCEELRPSTPCSSMVDVYILCMTGAKKEVLVAVLQVIVLEHSRIAFSVAIRLAVNFLLNFIRNFF